MVMPSEEYVQMLIENEESNRRDGWHGRVAMLKDLKQQASLLAWIEDPQFDILKDPELCGKPRRKANVSTGVHLGSSYRPQQVQVRLQYNRPTPQRKVQK